MLCLPVAQTILFRAHRFIKTRNIIIKDIILKRSILDFDRLFFTVAIKEGTNKLSILIMITLILLYCLLLLVTGRVGILFFYRMILYVISLFMLGMYLVSWPKL